MNKHELHAQPMSVTRQVLTVGLMIIGLTLFLVFGAIGASKANDKKVVEGEPRFVASKSTSQLAATNASQVSSYSTIERQKIPDAKELQQTTTVQSEVNVKKAEKQGTAAQNKLPKTKQN